MMGEKISEAVGNISTRHAGKKSESENMKNDLTSIIQEMINNGVLNLGAISQ